MENNFENTMATDSTTRLMKKRLIVGVLAINLTVAGIIFFSLMHSRNAYDERAAITTRNITQIFSEELYGTISKVDIAIQAVADEAERQLQSGNIDGDALSIYIVRTHARLPQLVAFRATDASGDAIYGPAAKPAKTTSLAHRDYFARLRDTPSAGLVISKPLVGGISGKWMIILARRINNRDGSFAGLVYAGVAIDHLTRTFSKVNVGSKGSIALFDAEQTLIARHPEHKMPEDDARKNVLSSQFQQLLNEGRTEGTYKAISRIDHIERTYSFRRSPSPYQFYIIAGLSTAEYFSHWRTEAYLSSAFMVVFVLITTWSSFAFYREWRRHREAEQAALKSEQRFRMYIENIDDVIYNLSPAGTFTYVSPNIEKSLGYLPKEIYGKPFEPFVHPDDLILCRSSVQELFENGINHPDLEFRAIHKNGTPVWYSVNASLLHDDERDEVSMIGVARNITERKKAEEELLKVQEQRKIILDTAMDGFCVLDASGHITDVNETYCRMTGYSRQELLTMTLADLEGAESGNEMAAHMHAIALTGEDRFESCHRRRNGSLLAVEVSVQYRSSDGGCFVSFIRDITARKRAEEEHRQLEKQLLHTQKLESLGVLAGGIAHDFNNILMSIIGNTDLALRRIHKESPVIDNLRKVEQAAERAAELAGQMLAYSGKGRFVIEYLDINLLIQEMLQMLEVSISKKAALRLDLATSLPMVEADAAQIRQVIMNLVINASESLGNENGAIALRTDCLTLDDTALKELSADFGMTPGRYIVIEVADTGCGMSEATLARIFEPFFTTKFTGRGLGMAAVYGIVRGHKGAFKVVSSLGHGTTFTMYLPASEKPADESASNSSVCEWHGSGTVLLVDDEQDVRDIGTLMLTDLGFTVITANDGREAISLCAKNPHISFVILDLTMPLMDGEECFRELRRIKPDILVILSSGYSESEISSRFTEVSPNGFIQKPYNLSTLEQAIRHYLYTTY